MADTIAPTTPADLAVASTTETSVTLNWTASTDAVGVDHYDVFTVRLEGPRFGKHYVYTLVASSTATRPTTKTDPGRC